MSRQPNGGRPRILVVEDEPRIASFLEKGLSLDGCTVVLAEDGEVGSFLATTEPFDLVTLDVGLPGRSGIEVLREIRQGQPDLPIVMLTGYDDPERRQECLDAGASEVVSKPLEFKAFRATVRAHLEAAER